eukprot:SAG31_NODE_26729_length_437_cov_1.130178_1_plen_52_part_01
MPQEDDIYLKIKIRRDNLIGDATTQVLSLTGNLPYALYDAYILVVAADSTAR